MADVEYRVVLDDDQVIKALKNIDRNLDKLAGDGERSFSRVSKEAKSAGVQIGAMAGITQELVRRFINLGQQAARALLEIAKGGVELNQQLELLELRLTAILSGNQQAASAFLEAARDTARELRIDYIELAELATLILPDAKDLEVSAKLAGQTLLLARAVGADARRARISITEALAGQFVSIRRVLNLSSAQVKKIQELEPSIGRAAAISQVLGDRLEAIGFSAEALSGSFTALFAIIKNETQRVQQIFGAPIFEELKEQAEAFLEVFGRHEDEIERVALAFGQFLADVVEFIGSNFVQFLDDIDYDLLEDTADALSDAVAAADALVQILTDGDVNSALDAIKTTAEDIAEAMYTAALAAALLKAELARRQAEAAVLQEQGRGLRLGPIVVGTADDPRVKAAGEDAYNDILEDQVAIIQELNERLKDNTERTEQRREKTEEDTQATLDAAQADLRREAALEELAQAEEAAAEAGEKLGERLNKLAIDRQRDLLDTLRKQGRQQIEDEIEFAQKREDIARANADKIEDIYRKHQQGIADAGTDLSRAEADIARKAARDRVEVERDTARERIDIETDYRRELQRIRDRFNQSAAEAERRNDAQAYLAAVRQRDQDLTEAKRDRAEQIEDAGQRAAEQREEVNRQLQYEIEDARLANQRKLEDLQTRLNRELEAQQINYARDLEEQTLSEERKRAERARAYQQELEDFGRKEQQKLQDLQRAEEAQFEIIRKYERLKREYRVAEANRTAAQVNAALARFNPFGTSASASRSSYASTIGATFGRRQEGGPVDAGQPYIVGERGPELFVPARAGMVMAGQAISLPAPIQAGPVSNVSTTVSPTFNVAESLFSDPVAVRKLQNLVMGVLVEAL